MQTSEHITAIVREFLTYRNKRAKLKKQFREELKRQSNPQLAALGHAISEARSAGFRVDQIMQAMGLKNRNFLYEAVTAYNESIDDGGLNESSSSPDSLPDGSEPIITKLSDTQVAVTWNQKIQTLTVNKRGQVQDMPEDWLTDVTPNKKRQVQAILKGIRDLFEEQ